MEKYNKKVKKRKERKKVWSISPPLNWGNLVGEGLARQGRWSQVPHPRWPLGPQPESRGRQWIEAVGPRTVVTAEQNQVQTKNQGPCRRPSSMPG